MERENSRVITDATLLQLAVSGILSKQGRKAFTKQVNELNVVTRLQPGLYDPPDE